MVIEIVTSNSTSIAVDVVETFGRLGSSMPDIAFPHPTSKIAFSTFFLLLSGYLLANLLPPRWKDCDLLKRGSDTQVEMAPHAGHKAVAYFVNWFVTAVLYGVLSIHASNPGLSMEGITIHKTCPQIRLPTYFTPLLMSDLKAAKCKSGSE